MPLEQNGNIDKAHNTKRIYSVNHCFQNLSLLLIDVVNRQTYYIGQFLLDTDLEGNLIKISSLPLDCNIDIKNITYLKEIGKKVRTMGSTLFTIFGNTTFFQIVSEDFPTPCEGISGAEYFEESCAMLDFGLRLLKNGENYSRFMDREPIDLNWSKEDVVQTNDFLETKENKTSEDDACKYPFSNSKEGDDIAGSWKDEFILGEEYHLQLVTQGIREDLDISQKISLFDENHLDIFSIQKVENCLTGCKTITNSNVTYGTRLERLKEMLKLDHLNKEERENILKLIEKHSDRFQLDGDELLSSNVTKHRILTVDDHPVNTKKYRLPHNLREEVEKQVNELLEKGIIRP